MSDNPKDNAEKNMDETADLSTVLGAVPELSMHSSAHQAQGQEIANAETPGTSLVEAPSAVSAFPVTDKADKVKPPLTMEEKKKVWTRRIIGAILFFSVLGSLALLAAAQAVTFMFKMILSP